MSKSAIRRRCAREDLGGNIDHLVRVEYKPLISFPFLGVAAALLGACCVRIADADHLSASG